LVVYSYERQVSHWSKQWETADYLKEETMTDEYRTAIHEAGHAVMSALKNKGIEYVTILPSDKGLGECKNVDDKPGEEDSDIVQGLWLRREVLILISGTIVEAVVMGMHPIKTRGKHDYDVVNMILQGFDDEVAQKNIDEVTADAFELFRKPIVQKQIKAIADALVERKTLSGDEVKQIMKQVEGAA